MNMFIVFLEIFIANSQIKRKNLHKICNRLHKVVTFRFSLITNINGISIELKKAMKIEKRELLFNNKFMSNTIDLEKCKTLYTAA
jgi:hypothetical protein